MSTDTSILYGPTLLRWWPTGSNAGLLRALEAGADDEEIAEATGLDCDQVAAIRLVVMPV
jgi:hypothetical protein